MRALGGGILTLRRKVTVIRLRHRHCQTAQGDFRLRPGNGLRRGRSAVVREGLQREILMHIPLGDVFMGTIIRDEYSGRASMRSWLGIDRLHVVVDTWKQRTTALH